MANYQNLLNSIAAVIRTNGNQEITGAVLQSTLQSMVSVMGANATYGGVAHPTDSPGTPDGPVVYVASEAGIYTNFGAISIDTDELAMLSWNPTTGTWSKESLAYIADKLELEQLIQDGVDDINDAKTDAINDINTIMQSVDVAYDTISGTNPRNVQLKNGSSDLLMPKTGAEIVDGCKVKGLNHLVIKGYCIKNNGAVGDVVDFAAKMAHSDFSFIYYRCKPGDKFKVTCAGGNAYVAYTFIDSDAKITETSGGLAVLNDTIITAPANTDRLICQNNITLSDTFSIELVNSLSDNIGSEIEETQMIPQPYISEGYRQYVDGGSLSFVSINNGHYYYRKYVIDSSYDYYADVAVCPINNSPNTNVAGVAYLDSNNSVIITEFNVRSTSVNPNNYAVASGVHLSVPEGASYVVVFGKSVDYSYVQLPQLYILKNKRDTYNVKSIELTFTGIGDTLTYGIFTPIKPLTRYRITAEPSMWTLPDPTAGTSAVIFATKDSTNNTNGTTLILQNQLAGKDKFIAEITTVPNTENIIIGIRAVQGEFVKLTVSEIQEGIDTGIEHKLDATPNVINYYAESVKSQIYDNNQNTSTEFDFTDIQSAWAAMFPSTYKQNGKPTQVVAMLHGANGSVTRTWMGYENNANWDSWRNAYLANGFIVIDINGRGLGTTEESHHWGCPIALETLHKAFVYLKENYNVNSELLIQGSSMGGATAWNYAFTYPNDVKAMALAAPATISWIMLKGRTGLTAEQDYACKSWMYTDVSDAESDNYQKIIGYDPILRCDRYDSNNDISFVSNLVNYDVLNYGGSGDNYTLVGKALPCPVRIWHSPQDTTVPVELSEILTAAYRNGGQNVTLRKCPVPSGNGHSICTGSQSYVVNEIIQFMQLYS